MAVSFPSNLSSVTQTASIQAFQNAATASTSPALRYRYPQKSIGKDDDYLEINVIEYKAPGTKTEKNTLKLQNSTQSNSNQRILSTIQLPIPANIGDTNQVNWGDDSLNPLAALGVEKAGEIFKSKDYGKGIVDAFNSAGITLSKVATQGGGQNLVTNYFTSKLVNSVANGSVKPTALLSRAEGSVLNPNLELLFGGVNLRSFTFDFDFAPRNLEESNVVKQIIRIFKQSMAPKTGSNTDGAGLFIQAPNVFLLKYKTGSRDHPYLNKFKPCALTNMGMNYTGSGSYTTYADKTPVHMKLNLNFTELNPIYNEDYKEIPLSQGVGY